MTSQRKLLNPFRKKRPVFPQLADFILNMWLPSLIAAVIEIYMLHSAYPPTLVHQQDVMKNTGTKGACVVMAVIAFIQSSEGATFMELLQEDPRYPGQCYSSLIGIPLAVGQSWSDLQECISYTCIRNNERDKEHPYMIRGETCGQIGIEPPCVLRRGLEGSPYPQCCPYVVCPNDPDNEIQYIP